MSNTPDFCEEWSPWDPLKDNGITTNNLPGTAVAEEDLKQEKQQSVNSLHRDETTISGITLVRLVVLLCICLILSRLISGIIGSSIKTQSLVLQHLLELPITFAILFLGLRFGAWKQWNGCLEELHTRGNTWKSKVAGLESSILTHHRELSELDQKLRQKSSENDSLERRLLQKHRLENIGTLASGVAHDLNNALAPIVMSTELLYDAYPNAKEHLDTIETCARRGAGMVQQLLTYAKGMEGQKICVLPGHLIKEMESIISRTFPANIEVVTDYSPNLNPIHGEATQVHQVLLNLCVNARDAMPGGGMLALRAENVEIGKNFNEPTILESKPGQYVACQVRDTGKGISQEMIEKIFEPFISSKESGKGSGIGLSTVINILKSHQGFLTVESAVDQGSTFTAYFPACEPAPTEIPQTNFQKKSETFKGNGEVIPVVDDDVNIRKTLASLLGNLNFRVMTATNGTDAIVQATDYRADMYAIITDFHMPHIGGLVFLRLLRQMLPETPLIVTSGNFESDDLDELEDLNISCTLEKPFTREALVEKLESLVPVDS